MQIISEETYTRNEFGDLVPESALTDGEEIPLRTGQIITYEDRANPLREYAIIGAAPVNNWTAAGTMRGVCLETGRETDVRAGSVSANGHAGWQMGDRVLSAPELAAAIATAAGNKTRLAAEQAAAAEAGKQRKAKERAQWLGEYSHLTPTGDGKTSSHALGAKNIKRELSRVFPGIKFSVKSDSYSGGDSIDVRWDLGPTSKAVDAIIDKYQEGSFDGMTDCYDYDHSNQWPDIYGGAKYVHSHRDLPAEVREQIQRGLCILQHKEYTDGNMRHLCGENDDCYLNDHCHQLFAVTDWPAGAVFDRVESSRTDASFEFQKIMHAKYGDGWMREDNFTKYTPEELAGIETMRAEWSAHWCKIVFKPAGSSRRDGQAADPASPGPQGEPTAEQSPRPIGEPAEPAGAVGSSRRDDRSSRRDDPTKNSAPTDRRGEPQQPARALIRELKAAGEDREFYPTTNEIISRLCQCIGLKDADGRGVHGKNSILDIGAGNGKVLNAVKDRCGIAGLHAIEKSSILCAQLDREIMIVGTDFHEQSLLSKNVDVIFCNPPYSEYETWAEKIIRQAAAKVVFLVIPARWEKSQKIADALKFRDLTARIAGNFDFTDAEDRQARAVVHLVRIDVYSGAGWRDEKHGPESAFDRFFEEQFSDLLNRFKAAEARPDGDKAERENDKKPEHAFAGLVAGPNYPEAIVALYNGEMAQIHKNYQLVAQLDVALLKEFAIDPKMILKCLKDRLSGLKKDYWMELFSRLDAITSRLTSQSRQQLLERMHQHVDVDFTVSNILEVVLWVIKNANSYIDSQLIEVYEKMVDKCNVQLYKSNQKTWQDNGWRYSQGDTLNTHYALDYRIVTHRIGGIEPGYSTRNGLDKRAAEFISDLRTIARNLGFNSPAGHDSRLDRWNGSSWSPGTLEEFPMIDGNLLFDVRAFKNGNLHLRLNQDFILALNVEHGRLKGWLRNAREAAEELKEPKAAQYFQGNQQITAGSGFALLGNGE